MPPVLACLASRPIVAFTRNSALKLMAALALGTSCAAVIDVAPARAGSPSVARAAQQRLVILERAHLVFSRPNRRSSRRPALPHRAPITGVRTVLPVLDRKTRADGSRWLRVMLPGRPNGRTGWISRSYTRDGLTAWRLRIDLSQRRVTVFRSGRVARRFRAVVGKPSTPTPRGRFFVEETVRLRANLVGAPFALALSARSNVLQEYNGGPGQIALHGLGNVGGVPGTAASHGCLRLKRRPISWLAARIGPGVPVTITR
jgi:lipoprotein-anchoring transpeptidase ErfK/SrfK